MPRNGQEVVFEGWLTKSPPAKRIWRARWRRRWFSLQNSGELPGQYFLTYYTDRKCHKLKGTINLDSCEQVDTGLKFEDNKYKFEYMFDIKTPMRTYYLAADTEEEMKAWVNCICNICGLKATTEDETVTRSMHSPTLHYEVKKCEYLHDSTKHDVDSPPVTPVSPNPYIPISECITGHFPTDGSQDFYRLLEHNLKNSYFRAVPRGVNNDTYESNTPTYLNDLNCDNDPRFYDSPRRLNVPHSLNKIYKNSEAYGNLKSDKNINGSPLQSPTSSENVFTDDDWNHNGSAEIVTKSNSFSESLSKMSLEDSNKTVDPPPRPPKSLTILPSNYLNLSQTTLNSTKNSREGEDLSDSRNQLGGITDEMYDFPRSHQLEGSESVPSTLTRRHCYNNAAPVNIENERVFRYDDIVTKPCSSQDDCDVLDEPASPMSQTSSTTTTPYSNLPSPLLPSDTQLMPPPQINRNLKPKRKLSDSLSLSSNEPSSPRPAPSVDRTCKPIISPQGAGMRKTFESDTDCGRRIRAAPSPTLLDNLYGNQQMCSFYEEGCKIGRSGDLSRVQYLDLDHSTSQYGMSASKQQPLRSPGASTVYKQVDFMKTEAFNITRQHIEMQRKEPVTSYKK